MESFTFKWEKGCNNTDCKSQINIYCSNCKCIILLILGFYCDLHSLQEHSSKNKFHIFQIFDNQTKQIKIKEELKQRKFKLEKVCPDSMHYETIEIKPLIVVTTFGQILFEFERITCKCHDFVDDLLVNSIFPCTLERPSNIN